MTTQEAGTPEEQFDGAITSMRAQFDVLQEELERTERWLGSDVAANPMADHSNKIEAVRIAEAKRDAAKEMISIATGFRGGMYVARSKENSGEE